MIIDRDSAQVSFPPLLVFVGTLFGGLALSDFLGRARVPLLPYELQNLIGWLALVIGAGTSLSALSLFKHESTTPWPWKRSTRLVTDGVYRWTRNPMYLGMALIYAGAGLLIDDLIVMALLVPVILVIDRGVIAREERYLARTFGTAYHAYKGNVRRWF